MPDSSLVVTLPMVAVMAGGETVKMTRSSFLEVVEAVSLLPAPHGGCCESAANPKGSVWCDNRLQRAGQIKISFAENNHNGNSFKSFTYHKIGEDILLDAALENLHRGESTGTTDQMTDPDEM